MRAALLCFVLVGCGEEVFRREPRVMSSQAELRPTDTGSALMWRYLGTDVVASNGVDGGGFKVHFTRAGTNAVPAADVVDSRAPRRTFRRPLRTSR